MFITDAQHATWSQPKSGWNLFVLLAKGLMTPGLAWKNPAYRRKFILRSLLSPLSTYALLTQLAEKPGLHEMLLVQPGLPCRLHRPWLSMNMPRRSLVNAIDCHYQTMGTRISATVIRGYLNHTGAILATVTGRDGQIFTIHLRADAMLDKEGEATLVFCDADNITLAELTFTVCPFAGKQTLYFGGMQGAKSHIPHERIHAATKSCNGLFPKRLLVETAMVMGQILGIDAIRAVSNETHIYRSVRYRKKKQDKLHADYNSFWASLGATIDTNGDYLLPLLIERKPMEDIASKKRSEYRRRYELLDSVHLQTIATCQRGT